MDRLLDSWKEIAEYLRRSERTVQRWEREEGLPVHRHPHSARSSVFAFTIEVDKWRARRRSRRLSVPVLAGAFALAAIAAALWWIARPEIRSLPLPVPLTSYPGDAVQPSLSPDESEVAFAWNGEAQDNFDIYVKNLRTGAVRRLTKNPAFDHNPAWSPDGKMIAFMRTRMDHITEVLLIPPEGGPERRIAEVQAPIGLPFVRMPGPFLGWTPGGQTLVAPDRPSATGPYGLFAVDLQSGIKRQLTAPAAGEGDAGPAFSPDGRTLAFHRAAGGSVAIYIQMLTSAFSPRGAPVPVPLDGDWNASPVWGPNGHELIFSSLIGQEYVLRRASTKSGAIRLLAESGYGAAMSRRGHRLVYVRLLEDTNVWRLGLRLHAAPHPLAGQINSTRGEEFPEYAPDGKHVALVSAGNGSFELRLCELKHSRCEVLTSMRAPLLGGEKWSPDGRRLVFFANTGRQGDIYLLDVATRTSRRLTDDPADDVFPTWSRDGQWIYFASNRTGTWQAWKVAVRGGLPIQVTRGGAFMGFESPDGKFFYYAKDSTLVTEIWRVPTDGGEETKVLEGVRSRCFTVVDDGIYFISGSQAVMLAPFGRPPRLLAQLTKPVHFGITVSPDRTALLFTQIDLHNNNLMLLDDWDARPR